LPTNNRHTNNTVHFSLSRKVETNHGGKK
jgi:hypothetical protein